MTRLPKKTTNNLTVGDVLRSVGEVCPFELAAEWDNVGLIAGHMDWSAKSALLAIDLTDKLAVEAIKKKVDVVIAYHPPIFKGIKCITPTAQAPTTMLAELLANHISIIAMHTALDAADGGTNDCLLDAFDVVQRQPLRTHVSEGETLKLVVFVPKGEVDKLRDALTLAGAGVIGDYSCCSFELDGEGTFFGGDSTNPMVGRKGRLERVSEVRLEMVVPKRKVSDIVRTLYAVHSYEAPAFDLYPVHEVVGRGNVGDGRVGKLRRRQNGRELVRQLATCVDLSCASVVGELNRRFDSVTTAAGSFGVRAFRDPKSLVVTGEFKHHEALELIKAGVTAIHVGHDASERPVLNVVRRHLARNRKGLKVSIARSDRSPYQPLPVDIATSS